MWLTVSLYWFVTKKYVLFWLLVPLREGDSDLLSYFTTFWCGKKSESSIDCLPSLSFSETIVPYGFTDSSMIMFYIEDFIFLSSLFKMFLQCSYSRWWGKMKKNNIKEKNSHRKRNHLYLSWFFFFARIQNNNSTCSRNKTKHLLLK